MSEHMHMEFDLDTLVEVFGEPNERRSHPERLSFWFECQRPDGVAVRLIIDAFEGRAIVGVDFGTTAGTSLLLEKCDRVRVLEPAKRTLEVVATELSIRCFIALDGESIMTIEAPAGLA